MGALLGLARTHATWLRVHLGTRPSPRPSAHPGPVLVLARLFPPIVSGGSYRSAALVRHIAEQGRRVTVVAGLPYEPVVAAGEALRATIPAEVRVRRPGVGRHRAPRWAVPEIDGGFEDALAVHDAAVEACGPEPPSAVLALGPPFHTFVAGHYLARRFGAPLLLDYGDEWTGSPFAFVQLGRSDLAWERRCVETASAVTFTTPSQLERHAAAFPGLAEGRRHIVENGWDPEDFVASLSRSSAERVTLAYLGRLDAHAPPDAFLATLSDLVAREPRLADRLRVRFVGQQGPAAAAALARFPHPPMIAVEGLVSRTEAARAMGACDALLLLASEGLRRYRPGKLYPYLASGTPLLIFGDTEGEVPGLVRALDAGEVVASGDVDGLQAALERLRARPRGAPSNAVTEWLAERTWARQADALLRAVEA